MGISEVIVQAEHFPQPGQLVAGKYRMLRELGRGAMGAVFEAEHVATAKHVAVKWLHPHISESKSAVERLLREAQASARVRHSNVVDVYDVEREGESLFLVMEYLEGEPLASLLDRGGSPFHQVLALIVQAMRGVAEAHRQGIVHRDIKPDNIFLAYQADRSEPIAKVLDFGISKVEQQPGGLSLTQTGSALGTPLYMSFEQLSGSRDVDARSDIYAFGVILYETLTGTLPYTADNFAELAAKVITTDPAPPRSLRPDIPERLEQIVLWAMQKRRENRPPNLAALIESLMPFTIAPEGRVSFATRATSVPPEGPSASSIQPSASGQRNLSSRPPVAPLPSVPPPPQSVSSPPSLRLDPSYGEWGSAIDRSQRTRREMEDRVTALIAGTMHDEFPQRRTAPRRGLWMALGALTTLAGGIGVTAYLLGEPSQPRASRVPPPISAPAVDNGQTKQQAPAAANQPTPPAQAAQAPAPQQPAMRTQPEEVKMLIPSDPAAQVQEAASATPAGATPAATAQPGAGQLKPGQGKPGSQLGAGKQPAQRLPSTKPAGGGAWQPSGEAPVWIHEPAAQPTQGEPQPVAQPTQPAQPEPKKPEVIEVPGTAPNPFADDSPDNDATKYRAGKPSEEEF
ncbi:MAG: hypothetical protein RLZZ450_3281 [Pseudomonadota bacterium]